MGKTWGGGCAERKRWGEGISKSFCYGIKKKTSKKESGKGFWGSYRCQVLNHWDYFDSLRRSRVKGGIRPSKSPARREKRTGEGRFLWKRIGNLINEGLDKGPGKQGDRTKSASALKG